MKISVFYEHILEAAEQEQISVSEVFKKASSYGIKGIEIENKRLWEDGEQIQKYLKEAHMEISCIYGFYDFSHGQKVEDGKKMVDLAKEYHSHKIMIIPGFLKRPERIFVLRCQKINAMISALNEISNYAQKNDIMMVLEDFDDKAAPYSTAKGLLYFLDHVDYLKCAFDTGNFLYSEENSYEVLPSFLNVIGHVHCKDRTFSYKEGEIPKKTIKGREMYSCAVGNGVIEMKKIVHLILQSGYDDYFAIEHFGSLCQLSDIKTSVEMLNKFELERE